MPFLKSQSSYCEVAEPGRDLGQGALVDNVAVHNDEEETLGESGVGGKGDADRPYPEGGPEGADGQPAGKGLVKVSEMKCMPYQLQ